eukprot:gb/GEZJ01003105.1/.p2 GENE.gb/GEZJ01003105.1/~~gb/GEZJ01003105.1/.p2  ORF type:complete len:108 (+),score=0.05 gb/GEZJ01003105.1/:1825-2148(+)
MLLTCRQLDPKSYWYVTSPEFLISMETARHESRSRERRPTFYLQEHMTRHMFVYYVKEPIHTSCRHLFTDVCSLSLWFFKKENKHRCNHSPGGPYLVELIDFCLTCC